MKVILAVFSCKNPELFGVATIRTYKRFIDYHCRLHNKMIFPNKVVFCPHVLSRSAPGSSLTACQFILRRHTTFFSHIHVDSRRCYNSGYNSTKYSVHTFNAKLCPYRLYWKNNRFFCVIMWIKRSLNWLKDVVKGGLLRGQYCSYHAGVTAINPYNTSQ